MGKRNQTWNEGRKEEREKKKGKQKETSKLK